ncbi:MAG: aminoglycoside phosphotransferase family protein [Actinobacteria bacterium]|nr:aminoglycoside phosphotransferase family protein [Actinomycetota bacterium]
MIDFTEIEAAIAKAGGLELRILNEFDRGATGAYEAVRHDGTRAVVKIAGNDDSREKMVFCAAYLPMLKERGYPVPALVAHGPLREEMWFSVFEYLKGDPPKELDEQLLDQLQQLVELQADAGVDAPHRNWSWWVRETFFEGYRGWFAKARAASEASARLMESLTNLASDARGQEMHSRDFVHGDFGPHNVIVSDGRITGVLDWMNFGIGNRAIDLGEVLVAWVLLRDEERPVPFDGGHRLVQRILELAGEKGLLQIVAYQLMAGIAFWGSKGASETVERWVRAGNTIIEDLDLWRGPRS